MNSRVTTAEAAAIIGGINPATIRHHRRHKPVDANGRTLVTRAAAGYFLKRHPDMIRRRGTPVACAVPTRVVLYDLDELDATFRDTPRRRLLSDCA